MRGREPSLASFFKEAALSESIRLFDLLALGKNVGLRLEEGVLSKSNHWNALKTHRGPSFWRKNPSPSEN